MPEHGGLVVVANRLPVNRSRKSGVRWETSPGGLVSALLPTLRATRGTWIGWAGAAGAPPVPFEHDGFRNVPVGLSRSELESYYDGFANRTLWPLYHDSVRRPTFRRRWWGPYRDVNRRFAEVAAREAPEDALVWVQDYHLQLLPAMLRDLRPDLRIGFFLHIPFPPQELFAQVPWRRSLLEGLLGADVVGFQTELGARNFAQLALRFTEAEKAGEALRLGPRRIAYGAFPISIDFERYASLAADEQVRKRAASVRQKLGDRRVLLGVDRLDYTKGIDIRLRAYEELLKNGYVDPESAVLVQTAVPSRERVSEYAEQRELVERLVGHVNGEYGRIGRVAIHYLHRNLPADELVALYLVADVMLVTPLRDGMNLVCKEYVAARTAEDGVLVLSEFTGAAAEMEGALLVNPYDVDGLCATIYRALNLPEVEQRRRMKRLRRAVRSHDVHRWARSFLEILQP